MKERIKVLIGINDFMVGGAQKLISDQLKFFNRNEFEIILVTLFEFPERKNLYNLIPSDIPVFRIDMKSAYNLKGWLSLMKTIKRFKPDAVCSHLFLSNAIFRILKFIFGYKVIIVEHNTYVNKKRVHILIDKALSFVTCRIIAVSRMVAEFTSRQELIPMSKFKVVYNGIDVNSALSIVSRYEKEKIKKELGFSTKERIIINVARLLDQKNQFLLISAFSYFVKSNPDYRLIILGEGPMRNALMKQIKEYKLNNKAFLLGTQEDVYRYYVASDFFVLTSKIEGFGISGIEAMLAGLPLISTKVAGPDEYVRNGWNGYLVEADPAEISKKMGRLASLRKDKMRKLSTNATTSAKLFDIMKNVAAYEQLFRSAVCR